MTMCGGPECLTLIEARTGRGRPSRFCSSACRQAAYRIRRDSHVSLPLEMTERRAWTRRDGKRPITASGRQASSTNRSTWAAFADVVTGAGDGLGVMMGDGLGCYDIDHCLDGDTLSLDARAAVEQITERVIWVERSKSGHGLHIFVETYATKGYRRNGVEFYPCSRFIAVTGDHFTI